MLPAQSAVFLSSTSAVWSQSGAGQYAAANAVLMGNAEACLGAGVPAFALQLGPFGQAGMAAAHAANLAALGLPSLRPWQVKLQYYVART